MVRGRVSLDPTRPVESGTRFIQIPVSESLEGGAWIEIVSAAGTLIRLPQENPAALEIELKKRSPGRQR